MAKGIFRVWRVAADGERFLNGQFATRGQALDASDNVKLFHGPRTEVVIEEEGGQEGAVKEIVEVPPGLQGGAEEDRQEVRDEEGGSDPGLSDAEGWGEGKAKKPKAKAR